MDVDDLAVHRAEASAAMVLALVCQNIPAFVP